MFGPPPLELPVVTDPVAILPEPGDFEAVVSYASQGGIPTPFVIVMSAGDVPPKISGMAILRKSPVPPEIAAAILRALGVIEPEA